jgi:UDP-glucose 4-epimerase
VFRILRKTPLPIPAFAAKAALDRLWNLRLTSFPSPEIDYIRYVCMVDDSRAREVLRFRPKYGLEETVRAVSCER